MLWVGETGSETRVLRKFFWEFTDNDDIKTSWLTFIVNSNSESEAANTLFQLLGPSDAELPPHLQHYNSFQQNLHKKLLGRHNMFPMQEEVPDTLYKARDMFGDLGKGLRLLLRSPSISSKHLSSLITALFAGMNLDNQAACLLFSCEAVVKLFLTNLVRCAGGFFVLSQMLVAMIAVCGRLGNQLSQGLSKIVEWSFTLLEGLERKKMISEFWKEVGERLEEGDIDEDILIELAVLVGARAFSAGVGCESVKDLREEASVEE